MDQYNSYFVLAESLTGLVATCGNPGCLGQRSFLGRALHVNFPRSHPTAS
jgi:hypothetical protein